MDLWEHHPYSSHSVLDDRILTGKGIDDKVAKNKLSRLLYMVTRTTEKTARGM
jgi:hypothetical protein